MTIKRIIEIVKDFKFLNTITISILAGFLPIIIVGSALWLSQISKNIGFYPIAIGLGGLGVIINIYTLCFFIKMMINDNLLKDKNDYN
ncbi:hypothetical protein [Aliarcobacter butzleri]|uniref:hypothetical protein n=1 Tax=Aliarcobacter butzleri TaxID=28197 RepID=UPI001269CEED|nr:hypothetical protein [Aliarcobacter butzleri]